jgi:hypothetical protein
MSDNTNEIKTMEDLHRIPLFWQANAEIRITELKRVWHEMSWEEHKQHFSFFERRIAQLEEDLFKSKGEPMSKEKEPTFKKGRPMESLV